jgi:hypothetical protein
MNETPTIDTMKMVREIRDQIHDEMQGMTATQRVDYIRQKAAEAEKRMNIPAAPHTRSLPGHVAR